MLCVSYYVCFIFFIIFIIIVLFRFFLSPLYFSALCIPHFGRLSLRILIGIWLGLQKEQARQVFKPSPSASWYCQIPTELICCGAVISYSSVTLSSAAPACSSTPESKYIYCIVLLVVCLNFSTYFHNL